MGLTQVAYATGNTVQDVSTSFKVGSVGVTNPGSCWVKFPQIPALVPPRQYGVVLPPPSGGYMSTVKIDLTQLPSAAYVQDLSDLSPALITFYEDVYPVSPGQSLLPFLPAVVGSWINLGKFTTVGAGSESFTTLTVPPGTVVIGLLVEDGGVFNNIQLAGLQSGGTSYLPSGVSIASVQNHWLIIPINPNRDSTYTISWQSSGGAGSIISAWANSQSVPLGSVGLPLQMRNSAYDAIGNVAPAVGVLPSIVFGAVAGKTYTLSMISAALVATTAVIAASVLQVLDGATVIFSRFLSCPAVIDQISTYDLTNMSLKGTIGNSMTVKFGSIAAAAQGTLSAGVYLQ